MHSLIDLGQVVALVLIDKENIPGLDVIKTVVYEKLFAAGDGIINFITVMDMHIHGIADLQELYSFIIPLLFPFF